ncbi:IS630 family transposase [Actinomyces bowdenii]|uniref:IS630 family transposase n=1 Tax=Actinomyces bowdenii TaxID=131109 RepID=A0A853ENF9_9ACTO|nr:IS630 family transposase [Actinomyces bowdenii]MBF0697837.1 IS630 family transposase [Actinomyces bowdenii]NYS70010.1 IS630 family transposase [Actinomyces bowdenii]
MLVDVTDEERDIFLRWRKRSDSFVLVRLKAEAVLYASRGVDVGIIAEMTDRSERTVRDWLSAWRLSRLGSVVTGYAGNQNAARLTRAQKDQRKETLSRPPSRSGVQAGFWDVPAVRDVVRILFDVEYQSDSSYRLLLRFCGMSFKLPDPFDKWRDEVAITRRMAQGWEVYTVEEVRVEHESETRRMWLPKGERTRLYVDRQRAHQSFFGALSLTDKKMRIYPIEGDQNAEQTTLALAGLARETQNDNIAIVLDNARFHHAKAVTSLYEPGQALERITPIYLPPYAPDHNPTEHVWNTAKDHIADIQHDTSEQTCTAFTSYITSRTFDYDFEHLPNRTHPAPYHHHHHHPRHPQPQQPNPMRKAQSTVMGRTRS